MAQVFILQADSRDPYLLASIEKLVVNIKRHRECLENLSPNSGKVTTEEGTQKKLKLENKVF